MKKLAAAAVLLSCAAWAQDAAPPQAATLLAGMGSLHHPVSTSNAEAQQFFDQGMRLVYAFNHEEAARSFHRAADLDPKLAMAWWGVALAVGPNYNLPVDPEHEKIAVDAIEKARELSPGAPQIEREYIAAMAKRYSHQAQPDFHQLDVAYSNAMRELSRKYPDDLDAATLFADSLMNLRPWKLWNPDGTPAEGTGEIVSTLESVLRRDPNHVGAMHLYIHAVEASPHPEQALAYADRIAGLAPSAGHLVHMPAHIYERTGNYDGARQHNADAAKADEDYAAAIGAQGMYMMMYYSHNLHFGAISASMEGHCAAAKQSANRLAEHLVPALAEMKDTAMLEPFIAMPLAIAVRCGRWDDLLQVEEPPAQSRILEAFWLYGRGLALAARGRTLEADALEKQLAEIEKSTPRDQIFMPPVENHTWQIFHIADSILATRIAAAKHDNSTSVSLLREAVASQDQLLYDEPSDWYYPVRESLGGMLLQAGEAKEAEQVFRDDLARNPRNPRSLFGLAEALTRQHREYEASWIKQQLQSAWHGADVDLKIEDL